MCVCINNSYSTTFQVRTKFLRVNDDNAMRWRTSGNRVDAGSMFIYCIPCRPPSPFCSFRYHLNGSPTFTMKALSRFLLMQTGFICCHFHPAFLLFCTLHSPNGHSKPNLPSAKMVSFPMLCQLIPRTLPSSYRKKRVSVAWTTVSMCAAMQNASSECVPTGFRSDISSTGR